MVAQLVLYSKFDTYSYGQADDAASPEPTHGDKVLHQFVDKISPEAAANSHILLIDTDFGDDLTALTESSQSDVVNDIYSSFLSDKSTDTFYPIYGITASYGGGVGPGNSADEILLVAGQPGAVLQASANANQGGYNWASDPSFDFVFTVGAWNEGVDGNSMGTEDYLKSEIDLYADGYVSNLFGYSGFGTSFSTPAVAAETLNYLYDQTKGQSFSSASDHQQYLFDIISPGSTSLDTG